MSGMAPQTDWGWSAINDTNKLKKQVEALEQQLAETRQDLARVLAKLEMWPTSRLTVIA